MKQPMFKTWTAVHFAATPIFEIVFYTDDSRLAIDGYNSYVRKMRNFEVLLVRNLPINEVENIDRAMDNRKALILDISDLKYSKDTGTWTYKVLLYFDKGEANAFDMYGAALTVLEGRDYKYNKKEKK